MVRVYSINYVPSFFLFSFNSCNANYHFICKTLSTLRLEYGIALKSLQDTTEHSRYHHLEDIFGSIRLQQ